MKKENESKKLPGFYIALCCCVLAIGIAGYISEKATPTKNSTESLFPTVAPDVAAVPEETAIATVVPDFEAVSGVETNIIDEEYTPTMNKEIYVEEDYMVDNPDVESAAVIVSADEPYFSMPAGGEILEHFTDTLTYNNATADYRTHNGIDIAADEGCSISAAADGTVKEISADEMGQNITISHENGISTKYMCLGSVEELNIGDSVKSGDVIGTVGTPKGENTMEAHLHFEMYNANTPVDPCKYLN